MPQFPVVDFEPLTTTLSDVLSSVVLHVTLRYTRLLSV
jgi:hypothetical protein